MVFIARPVGGIFRSGFCFERPKQTREEEPVQDERNYWWISSHCQWTGRSCSWQGRLFTAAFIVLLVIVTLFSGLRIEGAQELIVPGSFTALCFVVIVWAFFGVRWLKSGPPHQG